MFLSFFGKKLNLNIGPIPFSKSNRENSNNIGSRSFDISIHVFMLLFLDSAVASVLSGLSAVLDGLVLIGGHNNSFLSCTLTFVSFYVQAYSGAPML
jgi:hypothetical protein